jgi:hypothetical protein
MGEEGCKKRHCRRHSVVGARALPLIPRELMQELVPIAKCRSGCNSLASQESSRPIGSGRFADLLAASSKFVSDAIHGELDEHLLFARNRNRQEQRKGRAEGMHEFEGGEQSFFL